MAVNIDDRASVSLLFIAILNQLVLSKNKSYAIKISNGLMFNALVVVKLHENESKNFQIANVC